jgi:hypothetical protein
LRRLYPVAERSRKVPVPAVERELAGIFAAIAGYSRLMRLDEAGRLVRLKARRTVMDRLISGHSRIRRAIEIVKASLRRAPEKSPVTGHKPFINLQFLRF